MGGGGTEIIGYDAEAGAYKTYFFDSHGGISGERLTIDGRTWTWQGETTRATSVFSDDGKTQACVHERFDAGEPWVRAMDITLTKVE